MLWLRAASSEALSRLTNAPFPTARQTSETRGGSRPRSTARVAGMGLLLLLVGGLAFVCKKHTPETQWTRAPMYSAPF